VNYNKRTRPRPDSELQDEVNLVLSVVKVLRKNRLDAADINAAITRLAAEHQATKDALNNQHPWAVKDPILIAVSRISRLRNGVNALFNEISRSQYPSFSM
jgi:ATP-dependent exoDNAse (exonuclease V) alpha subunit